MLAPHFLHPFYFTNQTKEVPMSETTTPQRPKNSALIRRFLPYLVKYRGVLAFDLFCAALTTLCDIAPAQNHEHPDKHGHGSVPDGRNRAEAGNALLRAARH